jgi:hypothetical protein
MIPTQAKVDAKADQATTYTETEVNNLLDAKADQATTYTKTKAAVDFGPTNDDVDTLVKSGFYRVGANANLPFENFYGQLIVSKGAGTVLQIVSDFSGRLWQRSGSPSNVGGSGSYSDWEEISGKADQATTYTKTEVDGLLDDKAAITGTATFSNSTNNIALTGIGAIGLEVGDVVQVTGTASNNKLFTVEVITDDDNVVVNQAHAGGTTSKSLVDETVSATVTLVTKWFSAAPGLGLGWVDVSSSRTQGVTETNNLKRNISVSVRMVSYTLNPRIIAQGFVDGNEVTSINQEENGNTREQGEQVAEGTLYLSVPLGSTYSINGYSSTDSTGFFWELR